VVGQEKTPTTNDMSFRGVSMCGRAKKRHRTRNHTLLGVISCLACGRACVENEEKTSLTNEGVVHVRHVWEDEEKMPKSH
jgi:hypothetical protein